MRGFVIAGLLAVLVAAGCGLGGVVTTPHGSKDPRCTSATEHVLTWLEPVETVDVLKWLEPELTVEGAWFSRGQIVRSNDYDSYFYLAAEIDGPGLEGPGDIGVWVVDEVPEMGGKRALCWAVNEVADEYSSRGLLGGDPEFHELGADEVATVLSCME